MKAKMNDVTTVRLSWLDNMRAISVSLLILVFILLNSAGSKTTISIFDFIDQFTAPLIYFTVGIMIAQVLVLPKSKKSVLLPKACLQVMVVYICGSFLYSLLFYRFTDFFMKNSPSGVELTNGDLISILTRPIAQYGYLYCIFFALLLHTILDAIGAGRKALNIIMIPAMIVVLGLTATIWDRGVAYSLVFIELGVIIRLNWDKLTKIILVIALCPIAAIVLSYLKLDESTVKWGIVIDSLAIIAVVFVICLICYFLLDFYIPIVSPVGRYWLWSYLGYIYIFLLSTYFSTTEETDLASNIFAAIVCIIGPPAVATLIDRIRGKIFYYTKDGYKAVKEDSPIVPNIMGGSDEAVTVEIAEEPKAEETVTEEATEEPKTEESKVEGATEEPKIEEPKTEEAVEEAVEEAAVTEDTAEEPTEESPANEPVEPTSTDVEKS